MQRTNPCRLRGDFLAGGQPGLQWARELADGRRPNVYPVGGLQEVSEALDRIAWMTSDAVLDQVIPAG